MINRRDFIKLGFIGYNLFIFNYKSDNSKINNIGYSFNYVRLK